jgi:hypothetical protein
MDQLRGESYCAHCEVGSREQIELQSTVDSPVGPLPAYTPAVWLCDQLDLNLYGADVGVNYIGGVDHVYASRCLARVGSKNPVVELLVSTEDVFTSLAKDRLAAAWLGIDDSLDSEASDYFLSGRFPSIWYSLVCGFPPFDGNPMINRTA